MIVKKIMAGREFYFKHFSDGDVVLTTEKEKAYQFENTAHGLAIAREDAEAIDGIVVDRADDSIVYVAARFRIEMFDGHPDGIRNRIFDLETGEVHEKQVYSTSCVTALADAFKTLKKWCKEKDADGGRV